MANDSMGIDNPDIDIKAQHLDDLLGVGNPREDLPPPDANKDYLVRQSVQSLDHSVHDWFRGEFLTEEDNTYLFPILDRYVAAIGQVKDPYESAIIENNLRNTLYELLSKLPVEELPDSLQPYKGTGDYSTRFIGKVALLKLGEKKPDELSDQEKVALERDMWLTWNDYLHYTITGEDHFLGKTINPDFVSMYQNPTKFENFIQAMHDAAHYVLHANENEVRSGAKQLVQQTDAWAPSLSKNLPSKYRSSEKAR